MRGGVVSDGGAAWRLARKKEVFWGFSFESSLAMFVFLRDYLDILQRMSGVQSPSKANDWFSCKIQSIYPPMIQARFTSTSPSLLRPTFGCSSTMHKRMRQHFPVSKSATSWRRRQATHLVTCCTCMPFIFICSISPSKSSTSLTPRLQYSGFSSFL